MNDCDTTWGCSNTGVIIVWDGTTERTSASSTDCTMFENYQAAKCEPEEPLIEPNDSLCGEYAHHKQNRGHYQARKFPAPRRSEPRWRRGRWKSKA